VKELISRHQSYKVEEEPVVSYEKAEAIWDARIGSARVQAYNWRLIAIIMTITCMGLAGGLVFMSTKSSVMPYIVEVGPDGARAIGPAQQQQYVPKEQEIKYFLSQFILYIRAIPTDPVLYRQNWNLAYGLMRQEAANKMTNIVQQEKMFEKLGKETVQVEVISVLPVTKDSWQVNWNETDYNNGTKGDSYKMSGIFTIDLGTPKTEQELSINPLGIYIKDFSWSRI
jgi:type IV secretion system protein VirB5